MTNPEARAGVTASAICMGVAGAVLLFAPREVMPGSNPTVLVQLLGAALLGYALANWTARGALLGGIYGRAVIAGNQLHLMVGAIALLTHGGDVAAARPTFLVLTVVYVAGAAFFTYLMFFSSGLRRQ